MITAQDIRERTFERARINGYEPASVDDFLDQLAEEVAASQKENSVLKAKMKVLVDKIEEYRANEEARLGSIEAETDLANQRLADAQAATSKYFDAVRALCSDQLQQLDIIAGTYVAEEPAPAEEKPAEEPAPAEEPDILGDVAAQLGLDSTQTFSL